MCSSPAGPAGDNQWSVPCAIERAAQRCQSVGRPRTGRPLRSQLHMTTDGGQKETSVARAPGAAEAEETCFSGAGGRFLRAQAGGRRCPSKTGPHAAGPVWEHGRGASGIGWMRPSMFRVARRCAEDHLGSLRSVIQALDYLEASGRHALNEADVVFVAGGQASLCMQSPTHFMHQASPGSLIEHSGPLPGAAFTLMH